MEDQKLAENHRTASISEHDVTRNNKSANKLAHQLAAQEVVIMQFFRRELYDSSVATQCLRTKIPLLVELEKPDSGRHGFSIDPL